jgi:hypothetical protein
MTEASVATPVATPVAAPDTLDSSLERIRAIGLSA